MYTHVYNLLFCYGVLVGPGRGSRCFLKVLPWCRMVCFHSRGLPMSWCFSLPRKYPASHPMGRFESQKARDYIWPNLLGTFGSFVDIRTWQALEGAKIGTSQHQPLLSFWGRFYHILLVHSGEQDGKALRCFRMKGVSQIAPHQPQHL